MFPRMLFQGGFQSGNSGTLLFLCAAKIKVYWRTCLQDLQRIHGRQYIAVTCRPLMATMILSPSRIMSKSVMKARPGKAHAIHFQSFCVNSLRLRSLGVPPLKAAQVHNVGIICKSSRRAGNQRSIGHVLKKLGKKGTARADFHAC